MFEDSLMESTGRIRTRSSRCVAGSFLLEAVLVAVLVAIPYLYPLTLPRRFLAVPLLAPPAPAALPVASQRLAAAVSRPELLSATLIAPGHIPRTISPVVDTAPPGVVPSGELGAGANGGAVGSSWLTAAATPPPPQVRPARPAGPVRISAGVAAGQLVAPIRPQYPAIAVAARIQGTVVVAATIGTDGRIESLHVVTGPPMLVSAAVEAIRQARYRPWTLNGEPVEVETTINVVFTLGGG